MKSKISFIAILLLLGLSTPNVFAFSYLGKTTWTLTVTYSTSSDEIGQSGTLTGGISKIGDEFYLFQGYANKKDGDNGPFVISGGGVMIGSNLVFTLTYSQKHIDNNWRDGGIWNFTIDKSDLNGTLYELSHDFDQGLKRWYDGYLTADITRTGPPIPMSQAIVGPNLLLLQ